MTTWIGEAIRCRDLTREDCRLVGGEEGAAAWDVWDARHRGAATLEVMS